MLKKYRPEFGRNELFRIGGSTVLLNLAKNPAGFNQNISSVMEDESPKDLIIVINDNAQDGTDISWLWDVDFDRFANQSIRSITVSGLRCQDMRLRLKYVGIHADLEADVRTAIEKRLKDGCGNRMYWSTTRRSTVRIKFSGRWKAEGRVQDEAYNRPPVSGSSEPVRGQGEYSVPEDASFVARVRCGSPAVLHR